MTYNTKQLFTTHTLHAHTTKRPTVLCPFTIMNSKLELEARDLEAHEVAPIKSNSASDGCHLHPLPLKPLMNASGFK
jgi:hypothetical protein